MLSQNLMYVFGFVLSESPLNVFARRLLFLASVVMIISLIAGIGYVSSESENGQLNMTLEDLRRAELAGAKPSEMEGLISQMNSVAQFESQLQHLPPQDATRRVELLEEVKNTLTSVDVQAIELAQIASQRTYVGRAVTYLTGVICAVIGTVGYYCGVMLYRRYRTRRIFRMKIVLK